jgi:flagellin
MLRSINNLLEFEMQINSSTLVSTAAIQQAQRDISSSVKRISTGVKLSQDDPASVGASVKLKADIGSLTKANENVSKGMGALLSMDSALEEMSSILLKMRDLAESSASSLSTTSERSTNDAAYNELASAFTAAAGQPKLGTTSLLDNTGAAAISMRVGKAATDTFSLSTYDLDATTLAIDATTADLTTTTGAATALTALDTAIDTISQTQGKVGGTINTLESLTSVNEASILGAQTTLSSITSVDMAKETAVLAAAQIRQSAAAAMFAQSNTMSRDVVGYLLKAV